MKSIIFISLFIYSTGNHAFSIWPDTTTPCNNTLQACIDGSPEGEYIEIRTDGPIVEDVFTNKVVSLVAGDGYNPTFSANRSITINSNTTTARTVIVKGLTLTKGRLQMIHSGANNTFIIENNTILDSLGTVPSIHIGAFSNAVLDLQINYNDIHNTAENSGVPAYGALNIIKRTAPLGTVTGQIYGNQVTALGIDSMGIRLYDETDTQFNMNITGNEVYGGSQGGLFIHRGGGDSGHMDMDVSSNAFYREGNIYFNSGIHVISDAGTTEVDIVNNSMINCRWGIELKQNGGSLDALIYNNLVTQCGIGFDFGAGVTVSNNYNLSFDNSSNFNYTPGANALDVDPKIKGLLNARLRPDSPADGAGNNTILIAVGDAPFIDADGLLRLKNGSNGNNVDIGAYERGDVNFTHHSTSTTHITTIDNEATNNLASLDNLHITANFNPNGVGGVYNNDHEGIFFSNAFGDVWAIFNQGLQALNSNAAFNVTRFASQSNTFEHTKSSAGSNNTPINNSSLNGNNNLILQVTQHWTGTYNPHPFGVIYFGSQWAVINFDLVDMPQGSNFNVYHQNRSKSAWEHIATAGNTFTSSTFLNNRIINGVPCAQVQVTQSASQGVFNDSPIGVAYSHVNEQWYVFNQDFAGMPLNAAFHVLINPEQVAQCSDLIFQDDFE